MTKTMLTVSLLTVVLTAGAVLGHGHGHGHGHRSGQEKYCNLDLAQRLCMENFNLTMADGYWNLVFLYNVPPTFQYLSRLYYDFIHNASSMPADAVQLKRNIVMKDGTCRIETWNYTQEDCPGRMSTEVVTLPDGTTKQVTVNILATDYEILVFVSKKLVNNQSSSSIGILVRDLGATVDWSAVDGALRRICGPRPHHGNWSNFFNKLDFDWNATCQDPID